MSRQLLLHRCFVIALGGISVWRGVVVFPNYFPALPIGHIASQIIAGNQFRTGILVRQQPAVGKIEKSADCHSTALQSAATILPRMVEATASGNNHDVDLKPLDIVIRRSLFCAPADPYLWLVVFWLEENGFQPENLKWLGPNERWIALKRNRAPPDLATNAINEFNGLIKSYFINKAVDTFIGPAWSERDLILASLIPVPDRQRQYFAEAL